MIHSSFYDIDFESIYPTPTPTRVAEAFFNRLWRKLHVERFSLLITFWGKHRVGKSLTAVTIAHILDETFLPNLEERVVYSGKALVSAFKKIREEKIRGGAVVIDEAGSGELSSQRWYEEAAKIINAELQAVGFLNPYVGFVTQNFSFINTTARRLSQGVYEVNRSNNDFSIVRPFWVSENPWSSNIYHKYPIFCEKRNKVVSNLFKINNIKIRLPPLELRSRYEIHSQAYKDWLLKQSEEDMDVLDTLRYQRKAMVTGIEEIVNEVIDNMDDYSTIGKDGNNRIDEGIIKHKHEELTWRDAKTVKALVQQKIYKDENTHTQNLT